MEQPKQGEWTDKAVREYLPEVCIEQGGREATYRIGGRQLPFAGVCGTGWTFAWATIARSLNTGKPLQA